MIQNSHPDSISFTCYMFESLSQELILKLYYQHDSLAEFFPFHLSIFATFATMLVSYFGLKCKQYQTIIPTTFVPIELGFRKIFF